jgi:hypothetical protein
MHPIHPMSQRNPWQGLTGTQLQLLDDALKLPGRLNRGRAEAFDDVAKEFAYRTANLLVANDLRGALDSAEITAAAVALARQHRDAHERAVDRAEYVRRLEAEDPNGRLVHVPGQKKMRRVFPADKTAN